MKKKLYIIGLITIFVLGACEKLDREIVTSLNSEQVNTIYPYSQDRATALYTFLPYGFNDIDGAMMASASDEAEFTLETSAVQWFNAGSWNALSNPDNVWAHYFSAIRTANLFLENTDSIDLDAFRLDPTPSQQLIYQNRLAQIALWKNEARFLRAFYYFELVKRYGGVPLITTTLPLDENVQNIPRNTLKECVDFITSECDAVAPADTSIKDGLPVSYGDADLGHATRGAAFALKAKALLFAASDLWNDPSWAPGYAHPELISLPSGDRMARWKAAADAALEVINLGQYSLASDYRNLFLGNDGFLNPEHILVTRSGPSNDFEITNYSVGYDMGHSGNTPSGNLVDAYEVKVDDNTAVPFSWSDPDMASNPYATSGATARDPRLFANVIVNNSTYKNRTVELWTGGLDGAGKALASRTGYYLKKYVDENLNLLLGNTSVHTWDLIRLADVYLWYAEALNEYSPGNTDIATYVNLIRQRPGVDMPPVSSGLSQVQMRQVIRHEREVELAFEGHRIWDLRRWMTATDVLNAQLKGVQITENAVNDFSYNVINVENRVFTTKMYFYPIPESELLKMPDWMQNPLW